MEEAARPRYRLTGSDVDRMVDELLFVGADTAQKRSRWSWRARARCSAAWQRRGGGGPGRPCGPRSRQRPATC